MAHLGPLVLETNSLKIPALTADRDQPVLRRFEPSSRSALMGEQTNPWDLLQPQDALSRPKISFNYLRYGLYLSYYKLFNFTRLFYLLACYTQFSSLYISPFRDQSLRGYKLE